MTEHYCSEHNTKFYENHKGDRSWWSHKIAGTDKYCNEGKTSHAVQGRAQPPPAVLDNGQEASEVFPEDSPKKPEPKDSYRNPINRSVALRYAVDLCIGEKIENKDILPAADKFLKYIEG